LAGFGRSLRPLKGDFMRRFSAEFGAIPPTAHA
jgi:hypothetical protein